MKIVQINTVPNGSTGTIMMNIHKELLKQGHDSYVVWGRGRNSNNSHEIYMNDKLGVYLHGIYSRITGKTGFASKKSTKKLLKQLDEIKPDIIHLHNIHGYYINIELLFNYIKKNNIKVIWTLHDCWSFTGHCTYFDLVNCNKWKNQCRNCPQKSSYPKSFIDSSSWCYNKKKELFTGINDLTIVTPSIWLSNLVKCSYLNKYSVEVINNGINTNVFKIIDKENLKFRKKYHLEEKKIILGVATPWSKRKGFDDFIELSKIIDNNYQIVMVGLNKKQLKNLPDNILGLARTDNVEELVDIYNSSDILFNPTYEDNYPTVNLEAIACGTPVITYNTGGSPESAKLYGYIVEKNRVEKIPTLLNSINLMTNKMNNIDLIVNNMTNLYIKLYMEKN